MSAQIQMKNTERVAKRVLEEILHARLEYRCDQSNGQYDFDLQYADGTVAAVEVTAAVDKDLARTVDGIFQSEAGRNSYRSERL
jgi:hypothetical protein